MLGNKPKNKAKQISVYISTNCLMPFPSNCAHKYATLVVFGMQSKKEKY